MAALSLPLTPAMEKFAAFLESIPVTPYLEAEGGGLPTEGPFASDPDLENQRSTLLHWVSNSQGQVGAPFTRTTIDSYISRLRNELGEMKIQDVLILSIADITSIENGDTNADSSTLRKLKESRRILIPAVHEDQYVFLVEVNNPDKEIRVWDPLNMVNPLAIEILSIVCWVHSYSSTVYRVARCRTLGLQDHRASGAVMLMYMRLRAYNQVSVLEGTAISTGAYRNRILLETTLQTLNPVEIGRYTRAAPWNELVHTISSVAEKDLDITAIATAPSEQPLTTCKHPIRPTDQNIQVPKKWLAQLQQGGKRATKGSQQNSELGHGNAPVPADSNHTNKQHAIMEGTWRIYRITGGFGIGSGFLDLQAYEAAVTDASTGSYMDWSSIEYQKAVRKAEARQMQECGLDLRQPWGAVGYQPLQRSHALQTLESVLHPPDDIKRTKLVLALRRTLNLVRHSFPIPDLVTRLESTIEELLTRVDAATFVRYQTKWQNLLLSKLSAVPSFAGRLPKTPSEEEWRWLQECGEAVHESIVV